MNLEDMYIDDLLKDYPYADDFFKTFGLELSSTHIELNSYLENLNKTFFNNIGIERKQLMEHFQYFILSTEKVKEKNRVILN